MLTKQKQQRKQPKVGEVFSIVLLKEVIFGTVIADGSAFGEYCPVVVFHKGKHNCSQKKWLMEPTQTSRRMWTMGYFNSIGMSENFNETMSDRVVLKSDANGTRGYARYYDTDGNIITKLPKDPIFAEHGVITQKGIAEELLAVTQQNNSNAESRNA